MSFATIYRDLLRVTLDDGVVETNARTGSRIKALPGGASLRINLARGVLPTCGLRKTKPHIAAAELAWCLLGHCHVDWLRQHTKVWDAFADVQPCVTCEGRGDVEASGTAGYDFGEKVTCENCAGSGKTYWLEQAYGNRWRNTFGVDQLAVGLERLGRNSSDRRVWISSWDPGKDILDDGQKTVPCPVGFTLSVMAGRLNSSLMIRSSDLFMGLPYDVMRHALLVGACAMSLNVGTGVMRVTLAHPHLYESQWNHANHMTKITPVEPTMYIANSTVEQIVERPDDYVHGFRVGAEALEWPAFDPKSEVVR